MRSRACLCRALNRIQTPSKSAKVRHQDKSRPCMIVPIVPPDSWHLRILSNICRYMIIRRPLMVLSFELPQYFGPVSIPTNFAVETHSEVIEDVPMTFDMTSIPRLTNSGLKIPADVPQWIPNLTQALVSPQMVQRNIQWISSSLPKSQ